MILSTILLELRHGPHREVGVRHNPVGIVAVLLLALTTGACVTQDGDRGPNSSSAAAENSVDSIPSVEATARVVAPSGTADAGPVMPSAPSRDIFSRGCDSLIYSGPLADLPQDVDIGPLKFSALDEAASMDAVNFQPDAEGRFAVLKFPVGVRGEALGPVVVTIAEEDRSHARFGYDPARWASGRLALGEGDYALSLEVCNQQDTQYNGGFVVDGPGCVTLSVVNASNGQTLTEALVPFGRSDCSAR